MTRTYFTVPVRAGTSSDDMMLLVSRNKMIDSKKMRDRSGGSRYENETLVIENDWLSYIPQGKISA